MTIGERLSCILKINPDALCTVWQDGDKQWVKYDDAHKGAKPTLEECEAVLEEVRAEIAAGNKVKVLTRKQALLQMHRMGVLSQVTAAIQAAGAEAQIIWDATSDIERDDPLYLQIKAVCGFTDEQEETFFSEGSLL